MPVDGIGLNRCVEGAVPVQCAGVIAHVLCVRQQSGGDALAMLLLEREISPESVIVSFTAGTRC